MKRVLVVEDESSIREMEVLNLRMAGWEVLEAPTAERALELLHQNPPCDAALLDIMLPGMDGWSICRKIRETSKVPIIMLTAKGELEDKVNGLELGADDYITKPFAIEELLARIRTALRKRPSPQAENRLTLGPIAMDVARRQVTANGTPVELTAREFDVLRLFLENPEIVLSRETFLSRVWGYDYVGETNVVDVYIRYLRSKLDSACGRSLIHTVRGVGYVLREA